MRNAARTMNGVMGPFIRHLLSTIGPRAAVLLLVVALALPSASAHGQSRDSAKPRTQGKPAPAADSLFEKILTLNRALEPELDAEAMRRAYREVIARARRAVNGARSPRQKVAALNRVLLTGHNVSYLSNRYWRDATLAAVLLRRKGNCLATSTLYVLVGEEIGLPIRLVLVPRHAYVRWDDGRVRINIETTNKGVERSDAAYEALADCTREDMTRLGWGRSLSSRELHAETLLTVARHRFGQNRLREGLALLERAIRLRPDRQDLALERIEIEANLSGNRGALRGKLRSFLAYGRPPPSVAAQALQLLAGEFNAAGDPARARDVLLTAFRVAPKSRQYAVLTELAFVLRTMRDFQGAQRTMELAVALRPDEADALYNLAILQRCNERIKDALATIAKARKLNPESWNLQIIEAGYLILDGQEQRGMALYRTLERPRANEEFYAIMLAWFQAARGDRDAFYAQFAKVLTLARDPQVLTWIKQDVDLDTYREEPEFKALVRAARTRLLGRTAPPAHAPAPAPAQPPQPVP